MRDRGRVKNEMSPALVFFRDCGIGAAVGLIFCIVFSLLAAFIISAADLPHRSVMPIAMAIIGISSLIGSLISGKIHKRQGLATGAAVGIIMLAALLAAGLFVPDEGIGVTMLLKSLVCLLPSLVGSVIGVNLRRKY